MNGYDASNLTVVAMRICLFVLLLASGSSAFAQSPPPRGCFPVSERAGRDVGCWLIVSEPLGRLSQSAVFWHLDRYPNRIEAESAKGPRSTVVEALGKSGFSLLARPAGGRAGVYVWPRSDRSW